MRYARTVTAAGGGAIVMPGGGVGASRKVTARRRPLVSLTVTGTDCPGAATVTVVGDLTVIPGSTWIVVVAISRPRRRCPLKTVSR